MRALNRKLLRDLWSHKGQVLAIAFIIAGGVATYITSASTLASLLTTQSQFYREYRFADVFANLKRAPENVGHRLSAVAGVDRAYTRVIAQAQLRVEGFDDPISGRLVSIPDKGRPPLNRLFLRAGRRPAPQARDEALVSEAFAEAHALQPGDTVSTVINGRLQALTVAGIALSPEFVYQAKPGALFPDYKRYGILWMRREALAAAYDMEGAFNDAVFRLAPGAQPAAVIERVDALLAPYGGLGAYTRQHQLSHRFLSQEIDGIKVMAWFFPLIFLGVAAFLLNVVTSRLIHTQRPIVALLKAFGYAPVSVAAHYMGWVALILALGTCLGTLAGLGLGRALSQLYIEFFRFPELHFQLEPRVVLTGFAVAATASLAGTLHALQRVASLPPAQAMRPEMPSRYRVSVFERLGLARVLDQPSRMIVRQITRQPVKSGLTVVGLALSVGILVVGSFQEDAIDYITRVQFTQIQRPDLTVTFNEAVDAKVLDSLARMEGVHHVEGFRSVAATLKNGHQHERSSLTGLSADGELHRVLNTRGDRVALPEQGLIVSRQLAQMLNVQAGEQLVVKVLEGAQPTLTLPVVRLVDEYVGVNAYLPRERLNRYMQQGHRVSGAYLATDSADHPRIYDRLNASPQVAGVTIQSQVVNSFNEQMAETVLVFTFVNTLLAGIIAFGVVYNSVRIAFSERSHELASLRILGFTRGEVAYILLGELGLLTLLALVPGFLIGRLFAHGIAEAMRSELYRIPVVLDSSTYALAATVVITSALISGAITYRRVAQMNILTALKTRE